jgi:predicted GNAT family N-acyltransferase
MEATYRVIHSLEEQHVTGLMELYRHEWWTNTRTLEQARQVVQSSDLVVGICDGGDNLVAFARVLTDWIFRATVYDVIVASNHRGQGLGHRVIKEVLSNPVLASIQHIDLYCRPELVAFYEGLGFSSPGVSVRLMRVTRPFR